MRLTLLVKVVIDWIDNGVGRYRERIECDYRMLCWIDSYCLSAFFLWIDITSNGSSLWSDIEERASNWMYCPFAHQNGRSSNSHTVCEGWCFTEVLSYSCESIYERDSFNDSSNVSS